MIYGYVRVSTPDQSIDLQKDALIRSGVDSEFIFADMITGTSVASARPEFSKMLSKLTEGDVVYIWKLDRLGRSISDVINTIVVMTDQGITLKSITEGIDTSTPLGRALAGILASFAQLEKDTIRERVKAGMAAAAERGTHCGRPRKVSKSLGNIAMNYRGQGVSIAQIARNLGVSRTVIYKSLDLVSV